MNGVFHMKILEIVNPMKNVIGIKKRMNVMLKGYRGSYLRWFHRNQKKPQARKEVQGGARKEVLDGARKEVLDGARKEVQGGARKEVQGGAQNRRLIK